MKLEGGEMRKAPLTVGVVGGGFTGAAASIACLARIDRPFRLVVVEPSASLGRGVAYGAHHPLHLLNVRTRDLSVRAGQPGDFLNWAFRQLDQGENHAGLHEGLAHTFLPRQLFGEYVRQRFFDSVEAKPDVELKIVNAVATACISDGGRFRLRFERSEPLEADSVLLATAYGLRPSGLTGAHPPFEALPSDRLTSARSMALIGSGLTMVDVLMSARREGFQGKAMVISRRGQLPRPHAAKGVVPHEIGLPRSKRMSGVTGSVAIACAAAEAHGTPWQSVINGLRASLQDIWRRLPVEEQSRFLRHVRPLWDAHRHRLPPEVHGRLKAEFDEGRAVLLRGSVTSAERDGDGFRVTLRPRGSERLETLTVDLAFDCTSHRPDLNSPLIQSLVAQGAARADAHRLGLAVEPNGQVLGKSGAPTRGLFALGPLCQGSLWEITAVPEIVRQCDQAATNLAALEHYPEREVELSS
ncbi:MAG TPA: FAD/NAD(P)-binding protein [Methyloceanibacter sp.]|nr:FAD/NAD(P)-binding protein [Methyloceanibacter sp.]